MNEKAKSTLEVMRRTLRVRNYSEQTVRTYCSYASEFLNSFNKDAYHISVKEAKEYLINYNYSSVSKQNQIINAVKFLYREVIGSKIRDLNITRPRKEKKLPLVIDHETLVTKIAAIRNLKHRCILQLAYGTGMRISELLNLKLSDIDFVNYQISVRSGKGRKDRIVIISQSNCELLKRYIDAYKPSVYLFNGQCSNQYSKTSCGNIVKRYLGPQYHMHVLRHSFATTLAENGADIYYISRLMGHEDPNTSKIYIHMCKKALHRYAMPV